MIPAPHPRAALSDRLTITNKAKLQTSPKTGFNGEGISGAIPAWQVVFGDAGRGLIRADRPPTQAAGGIRIEDISFKGPGDNTMGALLHIPPNTTPQIARGMATQAAF